MLAKAVELILTVREDCFLLFSFELCTQVYRYVHAGWKWRMLLLFSFELCLLLLNINTIVQRLSTCYFLLNYAIPGYGSYGMTACISLLFSFELCGGKVAVYIPSREAYETCYFLLNYAILQGANTLWKHNSIYLLFSFELCPPRYPGVGGGDPGELAIFFWIMHSRYVDWAYATLSKHLLFSFELCT